MRVRGSRCARFEVYDVVRREDITSILLLVCYKGGALWDHITIYLLTALVDCYDIVLWIDYY